MIKSKKKKKKFVQKCSQCVEDGAYIIATCLFDNKVEPFD